MKQRKTVVVVVVGSVDLEEAERFLVLHHHHSFADAKETEKTTRGRRLWSTTHLLLSSTLW
jgi:hypothetical protein